MKPIATLVCLVCLASSSLAQAEAPRASDAPPAPSSSPRRLGLFVGADWRALYVPNKPAHGPSVEAGVILFGGHLKVGIGATARPGPINPATFEVEAADGQTYRGSSRLRLRSDGATVGLIVAPTFDLPGTERLRVEIPVLVGQAAYGFYLTGKDRQTPDGRRVSAWENQLLDGRDSSAGLGVDVGLRLAWKLAGTPWLRPYVGVHYLSVIGFDGYVKSSYGGPGVALGVQVGRF